MPPHRDTIRTPFRALLGIAFVLMGVALVFMRGQALPDDYFWTEADAREYQEVHEAAHSDSVHSHEGHGHGDSQARARVDEMRQKLQYAQQTGQWMRQVILLAGVTLVGAGVYAVLQYPFLKKIG